MARLTLHEAPGTEPGSARGFFCAVAARATDRAAGGYGVFPETSSGARERIRTSTALRPHGPEPCASANSATRALVSINYLLLPAGGIKSRAPDRSRSSLLGLNAHSSPQATQKKAPAKKASVASTFQEKMGQQAGQTRSKARPQGQAAQGSLAGKLEHVLPRGQAIWGFVLGFG